LLFLFPPLPPLCLENPNPPKSLKKLSEVEEEGDPEEDGVLMSPFNPACPCLS